MKKTWMQEALENVEPQIIEKIKQLVNEMVDDNKVEDKTIKVRCIDKGNCGEICFDIEYDAIKTEKGYRIISDYTYPKEYFEEVKEDILMVECINNNAAKDRLIFGKKYPVINKDEKYYTINDEIKKNQHWGIGRFKPVPKEKQQKTYTIQEVFEEKEGSEFKIKGMDYIYNVLDKILRRTVDRDIYETMYCDEYILKARFTKVEEPKPVNTVEALKALEEGKTIQSVLTSNRYKKDGNELMCNLPISDKYEDTLYIEYREIENQWLIIE